jgi:hypothetical protein
VLNVAKLKNFFENVKNSKDKEGDANQCFNQTQKFNQSNEEALKDFSDIFNQAHNDGPSPEQKQN